MYCTVKFNRLSDISPFVYWGWGQGSTAGNSNEGSVKFRGRFYALFLLVK